ncbi:glycosyltransferase family 1 protein [Vibrio cholerae]|uniref:glycosyltransferase n=1 Tax=Vibrio cholerae TaxID=666 RepID=UPI001651F2FA|nr:glycosyltransferase [Vibrio cholerae]BCN17182.1 putative glycosyltransferase [Vibrio cholerae]GHY67707.1 glycosyltransferase family 1 protein [Vibrio cholerae]
MCIDTKSVVIVHNSLKTARVFRSNLAKALIKLNYKVSLVAPRDCEDAMNYFKSIGVVVEGIPVYKGGVWGMFLSSVHMNLYLLKRRFFFNDCFMTFFAVTYLITFPSLGLFNKKLVVSIEGLGSLFDGKLSKLVLKLMLRLNWGINFFSNIDEKLQVGKAEDLVTGGIGIDLDFFSASNIKKRSNEGCINLLYVGRLIRDKGVFDALNIFKLLLDRGYDVQLKLAGDVYLNNPSSLTLNDIEHLKEKYGNRVTFLGYSKNVKQLYLNSDFLLLPSRREGFPVCVMEASSLGVLTVAYKVPGCSDAIKSGINGFLVDFGDVKAAANSIIDYIESGDDLSSSSILYARQNFCANARLNNFIRAVFGKRSGSE